MPSGSYEVEILMDSDGPLEMTICVGGKPIIGQWHLTGEWHGVRYPQRISFGVEVVESFIEMGFEPNAGEIYDGDENGSLAWGLGWSFDPMSQAWRRDPHCVWRLYEISVCYKTGN
jgi:hypothetical protein